MECKKCGRDIPEEYLSTGPICSDCIKRNENVETNKSIDQSNEPNSNKKQKYKSSLKFAYFFIFLSILFLFLMHIEYVPQTGVTRFTFFDHSWFVGLLLHLDDSVWWGSFFAFFLINNLFNIPAIIIILFNRRKKKHEIVRRKAKKAQIIWGILFLFTLIIT